MPEIVGTKVLSPLYPTKGIYFHLKISSVPLTIIKEHSFKQALVNFDNI